MPHLVRLLSALTAPAAASAAALPCPTGWMPVAPPLTHDAIAQADLAFNASAPSSQLPVIAYTFLNVSTGSSNLVVAAATAAGGWETLAVHAPQYAQVYDSLTLRIRDSGIYLGVSDAGYASVLRSGGSRSVPPYDGYDGSWAIIETASSWAYAIDQSGDMRALAWQGATTQATTSSTDVPLLPLNFSWLGAATYGQEGWGARYPATDTWGPASVVFTPPAPPAWGPGAFDVALAEGPSPMLFAAYAASPTTLGVAAFASGNSSAPAVPIGAPLAGASSGAALAWTAPWLCVSGVGAAGGGSNSGWAVRVWCASVNASASAAALQNTAWAAMDTCAAGPGAAPASTSLTVTAAGVVLVAVVPSAAAGGGVAVLASAPAGAVRAWSSIALGPGANVTAAARVRTPPPGSSSSASSPYAALLLLTSAAQPQAGSAAVALTVCSLPATTSGSGSVGVGAAALVAAIAAVLATVFF